MNFKSAVLAFYLISSVTLASYAQERTVLTVNSAISSVTYSIKQLESLPHTILKTETHWTEGEQVFEGVLLRTLLKDSQDKAKSLTAFALNDYSVQIPISDIRDYPVLLAYKHNGSYMAIRNKGPLWVVYPLRSL